MDVATIEQERRKVIEQYGGWTDHNVRIADDLYTIDATRVSEKLR